MSNQHLLRLQALLKQADLPFEADEEKIELPIPVQDQLKKLHISTQMGGMVVRFQLLNLISAKAVRDTEHLGAFLAFLNRQNWTTAAGSCELDTDGEVRVVVELPLADAEITSDQLRLVLNLLMSHGKDILTEGVAVLNTGEVPDDEPQTPVSAARQEQNTVQAILVRFMGMTDTAEGRSQLAAIASPQSGLPAEVREMARLVLAKTGPTEL